MSLQNKLRRLKNLIEFQDSEQDPNILALYNRQLMDLEREIKEFGSAQILHFKVIGGTVTLAGVTEQDARAYIQFILKKEILSMEILPTGFILNNS